MSLDPKRAVAELKELRALTGDENGAQRVAWTDTWLQAREWFRAKVKSLPVEQHSDAAGNNWVTLPGASEKSLLIGGHLDSVPNGGWLDGALNVIAGLEVLRRIAVEFGGRPPVSVRLVDWADEEGARFGRSLLGSSAFAGTHSIAADRIRTDRDGVKMEDALRRCGVQIAKFSDAEREQKNAAAYIELHIEQGPVLERMGLPLAVVLGTKGVERHIITFHGQEAHSGSTPMNARRDALAAAAKLALEIRTIAKKHEDAVCTVGSVKTFPGIVTAVVGRCEATLDQRDLDANVLAQMYREPALCSGRKLHGRVVAPLEHRTGSVSSAVAGLVRGGCPGNLRYFASHALGSAARCRRSRSRRNPYGHDVRAVAEGDQPQQDRGHPRRASGNVRRGVRPPSVQSDGLDSEVAPRIV
jgi:N-carbamoyl-L-amino-acid hydrolase